MMRVLLTGSAGYLGGRIARSLASLPEVFLRLAPREPHARPAFLAQGEVVPCDVRDPVAVRRAVAGMDAIVHLAAATEIAAAADPVAARELSAVGTANLRSALPAGCRFIHFSTAHVYGAALCGTVTESTVPVPAHAYGIAHRAGEEAALAAPDGVRGIVLRFSNAFGAPADAAIARWTLLVNDLCRQVVTTGRLALTSAGTQYRDFICMADVCGIVRHFLFAAPAATGLFNAGGGRALRVLDMAHLIAERAERLTGVRPPVSAQSPVPGNAPPALEYRIDRLRSTGYRLMGDPAVEIDETLTFCRAAFGGTT